MSRLVGRARYFLELFLDDGTQRVWNGTGSQVFDGDTYTGLGNRWTPPDRIRRESGLKSETLNLSFDSSRQGDDADFIGNLLDEKWRHRQARLRQVVYDFGDTPDDGTTIVDEVGRIKNLTDTIEAGAPVSVDLQIESGSIIYLERRMQTRTPENQKYAFPGDKGFDLAAQLAGVKLPWRTKSTPAGTVEIVLPDGEPVAREMQLGRFTTNGSFVAAFTNGEQRKYFQRVIALADHQITSLDKIWLDGELVRSGALTHGVKTHLSALDSGGARLWATFYDGRDDQTADSYLAGAATEWTSSHRLRGVAYVIMEILYDDDNSQAPTYRFSGTGAKLYDRRLDSTAGGSGSHRLATPSTWAYSTNPAVAADHYRLGRVISASSSVKWFGLGESPDLLPYAEFEDLADHCDELVTLKGGGSHKRYEVNGTIYASDDHAKNLETLATAMAGRAIDQGGRVVIRSLRVQSSVVTLTDGDLTRDGPSIASPAGKSDELANIIEGRFVDPAQDYKRVDYPRVASAQYIEDDFGEIPVTVDLLLENNGERAQRIASLELARSRRIFTLEESYLSKGAVIRPGDWYTRESALRGFASGKIFEAEQVERFADGSVRVTGVEVDPDDLAWDENDAGDVTVPPALPSLDAEALIPPDLTVTAQAVSGSGAVFPSVKIELDYGLDALPYQTSLEIVRDGGSGSPDPTSPINTKTVNADRDELTITSGLLPSTDYLVRARAEFGGRRGAWGDYEPFTTTNALTASGFDGQADVISRFAALEGNRVKNALFREPWTGSLPPSWVNWRTSTKSQQTGEFGSKVYRDSMISTGEAGVSQHVLDLTSGLWTCRAVVRRVAGFYRGSGVFLSPRNSGGTALPSIELPFETKRNSNGNISNSHDGVTEFVFPVSFPAGTVSCYVYAMTQFNDLGTATPKTLDWYQLSLEPDTTRVSNSFLQLPVNVALAQGASWNPANPLSSGGSTSIAITATTISYAGTALSVPSGTITGLTADTKYAVFYDLETGTHSAQSLTAAAYFTSNDRYVALGVQTTQQGGGGFSPPPPPSPGGGGGQYGGGTVYIP